MCIRQTTYKAITYDGRTFRALSASYELSRVCACLQHFDSIAMIRCPKECIAKGRFYVFLFAILCAICMQIVHEIAYKTARVNRLYTVMHSICND
jgi:hypothetical protein